MKSEVLAYFHMPQMTLIGLTIFLTFFLSMVIWVYRRQRVPLYQHLANLPLGDD
ncbi:MAG: CcoQ/FixQ family Cbb3-type cytochrome c oxidase assembly chaperone [Candidatus Melainabacteria bacterium HGW-Melainabacteria-1]|nr:MAG: CcoQ/FixQ family Cbb3-type cytochrome c oxidase assembly chaperone [Candidatus Melainabacteria bacterium HGW-Melainabacteria-1]